MTTEQQTREQVESELEFRQSLPVGYSGLRTVGEDGKARMKLWPNDQAELECVAREVAVGIVGGVIRDAVIFERESESRCCDVATFYGG